jgi:hypothetical protein
MFDLIEESVAPLLSGLQLTVTGIAGVAALAMFVATIAVALLVSAAVDPTRKRLQAVRAENAPKPNGNLLSRFARAIGGYFLGRG